MILLRMAFLLRLAYGGQDGGTGDTGKLPASENRRWDDYRICRRKSSTSTLPSRKAPFKV